MLGEEKLKQRLILAYEIGTLCVDSMTSVSVISDLTTVPKATIKRYLNVIKENHNDYINLLPELVDEENLRKLQLKIEEQKNENIIQNEYAFNEGVLVGFDERIENIKNLYQKFRPLTDVEIRQNILNLQLNGLSMRKISEATGVSLGRVHRIINNSKSK